MKEDAAPVQSLAEEKMLLEKLSTAPNQIEIIKLLSRLKSETPDYSSDLMAARKAAFINQAVVIKFGGPKQGDRDGGNGCSGTSAGLGGSGTLGRKTTPICNTCS